MELVSENPIGPGLADFHCLVRIEGAKLLLTPSGDMDFAALATLTAVRALIDPYTSAVHVELGGVPFMDSSGINFLTSLQDDCGRRGIALEVAGLRSQPRQLLMFIGDRLYALCARGCDDQVYR
ncbi:STAS domain-containing protein [Streptomyces xanthophaeus]|uniref:STAS domain-containing protein n=1 Tax=Streptomyces xanthophaeus TaxID=67385 RepID=UPI00398FEC05